MTARLAAAIVIAAAAAASPSARSAFACVAADRHRASARSRAACSESAAEAILTIAHSRDGCRTRLNARASAARLRHQPAAPCIASACSRASAWRTSLRSATAQGHDGHCDGSLCRTTRSRHRRSTSLEQLAAVRPHTLTVRGRTSDDGRCRAITIERGVEAARVVVLVLLEHDAQPCAAGRASLNSLEAQPAMSGRGWRLSTRLSN